jgi:hypothetical protein
MACDWGRGPPFPGGRLTPGKTTCPRLRTPKPPMRRRWGTVVRHGMALVMGCDATPPPDATANIPAPMVCGCGCYLWLPPPLSLSCPSPAPTCLLLPTSTASIANNVASLSPSLHRDTGCGFVAPACPAARLSRSAARLETAVSANQARPFVSQPRIYTGQDPAGSLLPSTPNFLPPSTAARLLSSRRLKPGSHG